MDLSVAEGKLTLYVRGADKLWSFKSSLEIPLVHIRSVRADPDAARGWYHGIRMPRTIFGLRELSSECGKGVLRL